MPLLCAVPASSRFCPRHRNAGVQAGPRWAFGDEGREGVPAGATVELTIELLRVKTVKSIDPDHTGAVSKTILVDGAAYHTPNDYAAVTVSWTAALADGTQFDEVIARSATRSLRPDTALPHLHRVFVQFT